MMKDYLQKQIALKRERLLEIDKDRSSLVGEIRAYEDALHHAEAGNGVKSMVAGDGGGGAVAIASAGGGRGVSEHWGLLLVALHKLDKAFTTEDVLAAAKQAGIQTSAVNVRSQIAIYRKKKILERVRVGKYRVRRTALEQLGLTAAENKDSTPTQSSEARNH